MPSRGVTQPMSRRSLECLELCLPMLDDRTSERLLVLGHATTARYEVFEVAEAAAAAGTPGAQRFVVSVRNDLSQALVVPMTPLPAVA